MGATALKLGTDLWGQVVPTTDWNRLFQPHEQVDPVTWGRFKDAAAHGRIGNAPENLGSPASIAVSQSGGTGGVMI